MSRQEVPIIIDCENLALPEFAPYRLQVGTPARGFGQFGRLSEGIAAARDVATRDLGIFVQLTNTNTGQIAYRRAGSITR